MRYSNALEFWNEIIVAPQISYTWKNNQINENDDGDEAKKKK